MFCQRYVGNLIESLPQIPKDSLNPKIQEIYIQNLESINKLDHSLINIKLKEKDTNLETGKKIIEFFDKLAKNKIEFKLTTPLPPCLFGAEFEKTIQKFKIPKSWEESPAFFRVKNRQIILCSGAKGPELKYMNNLDQIKEYFGLIKSYHIQDVGPDCKNCKYRLREACRYIEGAGK